MHFFLSPADGDVAKSGAYTIYDMPQMDRALQIPNLTRKSWEIQARPGLLYADLRSVFARFFSLHSLATPRLSYYRTISHATAHLLPMSQPILHLVERSPRARKEFRKMAPVLPPVR